MDTIFVNLENSKTSGPHVLILNFTDKIDLRRGKKSRKATLKESSTVLQLKKRVKLLLSSQL